MVALLILAFVGRVASPRLTDGRVLLVMGGVGTIGMLLVTAPTLLPDAAIVLVCAIACLLTAVSRASLVLTWMTVYARLPYRPLLISYALSLVALTTVSLLIALTGGTAAIVWPLRVALPPCCAWLAHVSDRSVPAREDDAVPETAWSFPLKPVLLFVAYSFVIQFTDGLLPPHGSEMAPAIGNACAALVILAVGVCGRSSSSGSPSHVGAVHGMARLAVARRAVRRQDGRSARAAR